MNDTILSREDIRRTYGIYAEGTNPDDNRRWIETVNGDIWQEYIPYSDEWEEGN